jgi:hypothetical protein
VGRVIEVSRRRFVASALSAAALSALPARSMADSKMQKMEGNEMTTLTPYLLFDGKCQQAMKFYKSCFGGELTRPKLRILQPKTSCLQFSRRKSSMPDSEAASWRFQPRTGYGLTERQFAATRFASI